MAKKAAVKIRGKFLDEKYYGSEPDLSKSCTDKELGFAYNWYNHFYQFDDAKEFTLTYLRKIKADKNLIKNINKVKAYNLANIGWNCRILTNGGLLPSEVEQRMWKRIHLLAKQSINLPEDEVVEQESTEPEKVVISIQQRVVMKANNLIADLEDEIDKFILNNKHSFDPVKWFRAQGIKPQIASKIADKYRPLYSELFDAVQGKNKDLNEAYARWKKPALKSYMELIKSIISAAETQATVVKITRTPRKKKEKPATVIVSKMKFKVEDTDLNIKSIKATDILGCNQLWVYNAKTRTLAVYNAMGPAGLNVKGSTLTGFDEKTSIAKKLRKPAEQLKSLETAGKVALRKFMDNIKCKPNNASGRINMDTLLLKVVK